MEKEKFYIVYIEDRKYHKRFLDKRFVWVFDNEDDADDFQSSLSIFLSERYSACCIDGNHVFRIHGKNSSLEFSPDDISCLDCEYFQTENCGFAGVRPSLLNVACANYKYKKIE